MADDPEINPEGPKSPNPDATEKHGKSAPTGWAARTLNALVNAYRPGHGEKDAKEWWKVCLETATILVVGIYTIIAGYQGCQMRKATVATQKSVDTDRIAMMLDQRPWVGVKHIAMKVFEAGKPMTVGATVTNTGKTPSLKCIVKANIQPNMGPLDVDIFSVSKERTISKQSPIVIFPNGEFEIPASTNIATEEDIREVRAGEMIIYYFGEITYSDIFGQSHETQFCGSYNPGKNSYDACLQHNRAN